VQAGMSLLGLLAMQFYPQRAGRGGNELEPGMLDGLRVSGRRPCAWVSVPAILAGITVTCIWLESRSLAVS